MRIDRCGAIIRLGEPTACLSLGSPIAFQVAQCDRQVCSLTIYSLDVVMVGVFLTLRLNVRVGFTSVVIGRTQFFFCAFHGWGEVTITRVTGGKVSP